MRGQCPTCQTTHERLIDENGRFVGGYCHNCCPAACERSNHPKGVCKVCYSCYEEIKLYMNSKHDRRPVEVSL